MNEWSLRSATVLLLASFLLAAPQVRSETTVGAGALPVVTVKAADGSAAEPGTNSALFVVSRTGELDSDLTVFFRLEGSAAAGLDYEAVPGSVIIHCGVASAYVLIRPLDDTIQEPAESVSLVLQTNGAYWVGSPSSSPVTIHDNDNQAPVAAVLSPAPGSMFVAPTNIVIAAEAGDPDGTVQRVDFHANNVLVGSDTTAPFSAVWQNPFPGSYVLQAKAVDNLGAYGTSPAVEVKVISSVPVVTVGVPDNSAAEPGSNTACFALYRTGETNTQIVVNYRLSGAASNGVDYGFLSGSVAFPAGAKSALVTVRPLDDNQMEPGEPVSLVLLGSEHYLVGSPAQGSVTIYDNDNAAPAVGITAPASGSTFESPGQLVIQSVAHDADGSVQRVEFWANGALIGSDTGTPYSTTWYHPPAGTNKLTAKAFDHLGSHGSSAVVTVLVHRAATKPVITLQTLDGAAAEPGTDTSVFQITRDGDTNAQLTVSYGVEGTAANGLDYEQLSGSIVLPAGARVAFLQVRPLDDALLEGTESIVVAIRTNGAYALGCMASGGARIEDNERCSNARPVVAITSPAGGSVFTAPTNIVITANAADPDGTVLRVEFWANNLAIGLATAAPYAVTWRQPPAGNYKLIARAVDRHGAAGYSPPVEISVRAPPMCPMVGVRTLDGYASEPGTNTALFQVVRSCATSTSLTVAYRLEGTAVNGVDYLQLPGSVTIPAGAHSANILVRPIDDTVVEQPESVRIILAPAYNSAASPGYLLCATSAVAHIADNDLATNIPPSVAIASPTNGSVVQLPAGIAIAANATDPDGGVVSVELFADGVSLGSLPVGPYGVLWTNPAAGYHDLTASATDNKGATTLSPPVTIQVLDAPQPVLATRQLPTVYVPGVKHPVKISVDPPPGTAAYTVEDLPPDGWAVTDVEDGGTYDPATHVVTFALTGDGHQELHYKIRSPDTDSGEKCFAGVLRIGTATGEIGGDLCISTPPAIAADSAPAAGTSASLFATVTADATVAETANAAADFTVTKAEVDAYELAWRSTCRARVAPNPVPVGYLTRAAFLWASGQSYTFCADETPPFAPMIWVPLSRTNSPGPWSASGEGHGSAFCFMPSNYEPGVTFTVSIAVTPAPGTAAYALQERTPAGWIPSNISDGGVWCPITRSVKFGLFHGDLPRTVTFDVTASGCAPRCAKFAGVASFDGVNVPVGGARHTACEHAPVGTEAPPAPGLPNEHLFSFAGEPGRCFRVEATTNLTDWVKVQDLLDSDGTLQHMDPDAPRHARRMYRIVPIEPSPIP